MISHIQNSKNKSTSEPLSKKFLILYIYIINFLKENSLNEYICQFLIYSIN